jgi:ABC-type transporter Mla subunit MlaD
MRAAHGKRLPNWLIGLIFVFVLAIASYVAFTKEVPWGGGTEFKAVFASGQNLRPNSPVRIAGVEVGKVKTVEPLDPGDEDLLAESDAGGSGSTGEVPQSGAIVTMEINDEGLPFKEDATFKLRPRLFLEGNLFVDVQPGSPTAPEVEAGHTFSVSQTSGYVQLDQVLTGALQGDARKDLQIFLDQFGQALIDESGAQSLKTLAKSGKGAFKYGSQVNEALLGENPHDLSSLIHNLDRVVRGLGGNEQALQDTVTNLRIVSGSFAAQDEALARSIEELPQVLAAGEPAFDNLNAAFPSIRAFAREILPGVRTAPETLDEATPLLEQVRLLSRPQELRGLVADLRPTVPRLAKLTRRTIPFLEQTRALSSCFNNVIIPWADSTVQPGPGYPANMQPPGPVYKETAYSLTGIAGESRNEDANGQYIRVAGGGGTNTVQSTNPETGDSLFGVTQNPLLGAMPTIDSSKKTKFKPEVPCENQDPPNLEATVGANPNQLSSSSASVEPSGQFAKIDEASDTALQGLLDAADLRADGKDAQADAAEADADRQVMDFYKRFGD